MTVFLVGLVVIALVLYVLEPYYTDVWRATRRAKPGRRRRL